MLFLQAATYAGNDLGPGWAIIGAGLFAVFFLFLIAAYVYMSFAYMALARKTNYKTPGIAWIPFVGPALISSKAAKMHWWPILLGIGFFIPFINTIAAIVFAVFNIIWHWKMYESIKKPGWWAIFWLIWPVGLVFLGIAAWSKK